MVVGLIPENFLLLTLVEWNGWRQQLTEDDKWNCVYLLGENVSWIMILSFREDRKIISHGWMWNTLGDDLHLTHRRRKCPGWVKLALVLSARLLKGGGLLINSFQFTRILWAQWENLTGLNVTLVLTVPVTAVTLMSYGSIMVCRATKSLETLAEYAWIWLTQVALANMGTHLFFALICRTFSLAFYSRWIHILKNDVM